MVKKFKPKKRGFHYTGEKHNYNMQHSNMVVCEDLENESEQGELTLSYDDIQEKNKRERIR